MSGTKILTLQVSDIVEWFRTKRLTINETFQRRSVWTTPAKTYLIDTMLCGLPVPKIYIRTQIDPVTQQSIREIVDGQQRIRSIVEFANNELRLSKRSADYAGLRYSDLDEEAQQAFLGYTLTVEQLLNASDDVVLEVFARLNSYTVSLNAAEKRHAKYQTDFKWLVRETAKDWGDALENAGILSLRQRFRMYDDELIAEAYRILVDGVSDGGAPKLDYFYKKLDDDTLASRKPKILRRRVNEGLRFILVTLKDDLRGPLAESYIVLALFAAFIHHRYGIPKGDIDRKPRRRKVASVSDIRARIHELQEALEAKKPPVQYQDYVLATRKTSPQRIAARRQRFAVMSRILAQ